MRFSAPRWAVDKDKKIAYFATMYAAIAPDEKTLAPLLRKGWSALEIPPEKKAWRDDYSNLVGALRLKRPERPAEFKSEKNAPAAP